MRRLDAVITPLGVTRLGWSVLLTLSQEERQLQSGDVWRACGILPSRLTAVVDKLVADGLVERVRPEDNRRVVLLHVTAPGRAVVSEGLPLVEQAFADVYGGLGREEVAVTLSMLHKVHEAATGVPCAPLAAAPLTLPASVTETP